MKPGATIIDNGLSGAIRAIPYFIHRPVKLLWIACRLLALCLISGCAPSKSLVVLLPDADGHVGTIEVRTSQGSTRIDKPYQGVEMPSQDKAPNPPKTMKKEQIEALFDEALAAEPEKRFRIDSLTFYFNNDATELTPEARQSLPGIIERLRKNPPLEIYVIGHTDRVGSEEYNQALSHRRTLAVERILVSSGISSKIILISYLGESKPRIATGDEIKEPLNRRVELILKNKKIE